MTGKEPRIVEGKYGRDLAAEMRKGTEVEITAMEVVAVEDIGGFRVPIKQFPGSGVIKVLIAFKIGTDPTGGCQEVNQFHDTRGAR